MTAFYRPLGRSGISVSAMGMGCWAIGGSGWGTVDDNESIRALHHGLDLGANFIDTADVYGDGHSEDVIAKALAGRARDSVVIATKFGYGFTSLTPPGTPEPTADNIRRSCEASLQRLQTDYIDLYQFHMNGYEVDQAGPVRDALEGLVADGKIRWYGWSTDFADSARFFAQGEHCTAIQVELNVIDDEPDVVAVCEQFNQAAINRGPLAMGLLTGKYKPGAVMPSDDVRGPNAPEWMKYFKDGQPNPEWQGKVDGIREILTSGGRTLAQGALAWLWGRSETTIPIPGFKTVAQMDENCKAMDFGALNADQMREIDEILERARV